MILSTFKEVLEDLDPGSNEPVPSGKKSPAQKMREKRYAAQEKREEDKNKAKQARDLAAERAKKANMESLRKEAKQQAELQEYEQNKQEEQTKVGHYAMSLPYLIIVFHVLI